MTDSAGGQFISERLATYFSGISAKDVPDSVLERARYLMLDVFGCALAARGEPFAGRFAAALTDMAGAGSRGRAVIGHDLSLPLRDAAMLNGILAHGLDFDDTHASGIAHLSAAVLPTVLALACEQEVNGEEALISYVSGLEAGSRLAGAAPGLFHASGFHPTITIGVFASAIAAARALALDATGFQRAQGFALSMAGGTLQFVEDGAWTKRLHPGWAASAGIAAAIMARQDFPTPAQVYEGRFGLFNAFLGEQRMVKVDLAGICADLGKTWRLMEIAVKPFPICHFNHACADAAITLHRRLAETDLGIDQVERIEAIVPEGVMPSVCVPIEAKRRPVTDYEAKFSIPYTVAAGLLWGRLGLSELRDEAIRDPRMRSLMQRVDCITDPASTFPRHYTGEVALKLVDGRRLTVREEINRGHPERPLETRDIRAKYRANAALWFHEADALELERAILGIEVLKNMRELEPVLSLRTRHAGNEMEAHTT